MPHPLQIHHSLNRSGDSLTAAYEDTIDINKKHTVGLQLFVFHERMVQEKCPRLHLEGSKQEEGDKEHGHDHENRLFKTEYPLRKTDRVPAKSKVDKEANADDT